MRQRPNFCSHSFRHKCESYSERDNETNHSTFDGHLMRRQLDIVNTPWCLGQNSLDILNFIRIDQLCSPKTTKIPLSLLLVKGLIVNAVFL